MSVTSGKVNVDSATPVLVYQTPAGAVTCLVIRAGSNVTLGDSGITAGIGLWCANADSAEDNLEPVTLSHFTGSLYGIANSAAGSDVYFVAADIR